VGAVARVHTFVAGDVARASDVNDEFDNVVQALNHLDEANLAPSLAQRLGLSQSGSVARGKSIIATEESRSNVAYGTMPIPDQVQDVVLPTDGLLFVAYRALWKESTGGAARAALFLNGAQLKVPYADAADPVTQEARIATGAASNVYEHLLSFPGGLVGTSSGTAKNAPPGTGMAQAAVVASGPSDNFNMNAGATALTFTQTVLGGACLIEADAGTYDVAVQFRATSGSVTVKDRRLKVWTGGF
jgi:hypothetical protein